MNVFSIFRKYVLIFFLLGFWTSPATAEVLPEPQGWVSDFAGVISPEYKKKISALLDEIEVATSVEIAVVTQNSIAPYNEFTYAQMLFDQWKIGKKGKDNGVLILIAVKERAWRIHTGYGMEAILPDALCASIGRQWLVPYLKQGDYSQGLYALVSAIAEVISKDAGVTYQGAQVHQSRGWSDNLFGIFLAVIFLPLFGAGLINFIRSIFVNPKEPFYYGDKSDGTPVPLMRNIGGVFFLLVIAISVIVLVTGGWTDIETWQMLGVIDLFVMGPVFLLNGLTFFLSKMGMKSDGSYSGSSGSGDYGGGGGYSGGSSGGGGGGFGGGSSGGGGAGGRY